MLKRTSRILAASSALAIFAAGQAQAQTSPSDFTYATRYDAERRVTGTIAPDPDGSGSLHYAAVRNTYDATGRLSRVETGELSSWQSESVDPASWSGYTVFRQVDTDYDVMDRKTAERVSSGGTTYAVTQYSYDADGRLECTAVRMNPSAFSSLPSSACTLGTTGSDGSDRITKNVYDAADRLLQVRKGVGTSLEQAYATYTYTANNKQQDVIDANGNRAQFTYDGFDRQLKWIFPSTTAASAYNPSTPANALSTANALNTSDYEQYGYDANGNRTSFRKRDGNTISYGYDALNRMTSKGGAAAGVAYAYDLRGLQTSALFTATSLGIYNSYDGFGELTASTSTMGSVTRTVGHTYDADGARLSMTWPDGNYVTYNRDGLDRLYYAALNASLPLFYPPYDASGRTSALYRWTGSSWGVASFFNYDGISRLSFLAHYFATTGYNATTTLGYNSASQITSDSRSNDAYAWTGYASVTRSYAPNGLNQYSSVGGTTYAYDANGNLTSDGVYSYAYDVENRLTSSSNGTGLTYDPLGRLWQVTKSGATTRFVYDGDELVAEYDASGNLLRRYAHSDAEDDPQVWYEGSSVANPKYLYSDHQGSIVAITDSGGSVTNINSYDEYGIPAAGNTGRFQYTGQAWLAELGMYYYKARIYSPTLGRFLQIDPVGYKDQMDLYVYVGNDPVDGRDPTGLQKSFKFDTSIFTLTYEKKSVNVVIKLPGADAKVSAGPQGAAVSARVLSASGDVKATTQGAAASGQLGSASAQIGATKDAAAASMRLGDTTAGVVAGSKGVAVSGSHGTHSGELRAGSIQPDKVPPEYRAAQMAAQRAGREEGHGSKGDFVQGLVDAMKHFLHIPGF